jgi:hypothetical protein
VLTLVWDVDDVLNDLTRAWLEGWWRPSQPGCATCYADLEANPPHDVLGVPLETYRASLDAFRHAALPALPPDPEVRAWFAAHGARFRHVALTATPLGVAPAAAAWVLRHFGRWIRTFAFVPSPRHDDGGPPAYDAGKAEYLTWLGRADLLLDDNTGHVEAARAAGIEAWLVPRPWNAGRGTMTDLLDALARRSAGGGPSA